MNRKAHKRRALPWTTLRQKGRAAILAAIPGILIIVISLTRTLVASEIFEQHQNDAQEMNLLGRQRMLSQKYLKEVLLSTWKVKADYEATQAMLDQTAQAFVHGKQISGAKAQRQFIQVRPVQSPQIRELFLQQLQQVQELERQTGELNRQIAEERVSPQLLTSLVAQGDAVLKLLDQGLIRFQSESNKNLRTRLYTESLLGMLVSLLGLYVTNQVVRSNKSLTLEIGQRRKAEAELRISEARFHSAFDESFIGMALSDMNGNWLEVNEPFCTMLGYTRAEMLSMSYRDHTHPDDLEVDRQYEHKLTQALIENYHYEKRYLHKSGAIVWVFLSGSLVFDDTGQPLYYVAQIQDITHQKQAEEALRKSETMFRSIVETSLDSIILADANGQIIFWNPYAQFMFGYKPEEVLQQPVSMLMPESLRPGVQRKLKNISKTGIPKLHGKTLEWIGLRRNGEEFPLELSLSSWQAGNDLFYSGIIRDLSEKKQFEDKVEFLSSRNRQLKQTVAELDESRTETSSI